MGRKPTEDDLIVPFAEAGELRLCGSRKICVARPDHLPEAAILFSTTARR
jgi:hypothetical protein